MITATGSKLMGLFVKISTNFAVENEKHVYFLCKSSFHEIMPL